MIKRIVENFPFPDDTNDYVRLGMAIGTVVYAVYLQSTTGNIPDWLTSIAVGFVSYYFGLVSTYKKPINEVTAQ